VTQRERREDAPPRGVEAIDDRIVAPLLPIRDAHGHKGSFGTLLAVAGSLDYLGAGLLVALAGARAGAGLICLAVPRSLQPLVAGRVLEAITLGLPERSPGEVEPAAAMAAIAGREHDALVIGSGLRPGEATIELVLRLLRGPTDDDPATLAPAVVDAEALNSLAASPDWAGSCRRRCVLTPHPGEFRRLEQGRSGERVEPLPDDDATRAARARSLAEETGQVVVLKGARTVVADPDGRVARSPWENPALATAGTGDVLAGTIGGFLAQGVAPFDAARLGVHLHGAAGDAVRQRTGDAGLLASELPAEVAFARRRLAVIREGAERATRFGFAGGSVG
jgi:NAD(P)H-hydrate epimerase